MANANTGSDSISLAALNDLPQASAEEFFSQICHCQRWAQDMVNARPFTSKQNLLATAEDYWQLPSEAEILEAFAGHARIGDLNALQKKYSAASKEQGQVAQASNEVIEQLFEDNNRYYDQNGFIFVVCATGKSAPQMLALLQQRLQNSRAEELVNGAAEQGKITALRLSQRVD